jgi:hypothetical protein
MRSTIGHISSHQSGLCATEDPCEIEVNMTELHWSIEIAMVEYVLDAITVCVVSPCLGFFG